MSEKIVELSRSYQGHKGFDQVVLRAPIYSDYVELGEVHELQPGPNGGTILVTYHETVAAYVDRLCTEPGAESLSQLDLVDAKKVHRAVTDFFTEAERQLRPPTSSSSASDSTQATSDE